MNLPFPIHRRVARLWGGLLIGLVVHPLFAQFRIGPEFTLSDAIELDDLEREGLQQLRQAEDFLAISQWENAIDLYQRVMQEHASQLIRLQRHVERDDETYGRYVAVRGYCQQQLASWSVRFPAALESYRRRVDREAAFVYEQGVQQRDLRRIELVASDYFASSFGDDALAALAEMALERGDYTAARGYFRRLSPELHAMTSYPFVAALVKYDGSASQLAALSKWLDNSANDADGSVVPDTEREPAALMARLVLVSIRERSARRARAELDLLGHRWPDATGTWVGQTVNLRAALESLYAESLSWPAPREEPGWRTFAGNAARNGIAEGDLDIVPRVVWERQIGPPRFMSRVAPDAASGESRRWGRQAQWYFPYHPVAIDNLVIVRDEDYIWALDVATGQAAFPSSAKLADSAYGRLNQIAYVSRPPVALALRHWSLPQYSLNVFESKLFGRMGSAMSMVGGARGAVGERDDVSYVVALDLHKQGKLIGNLVQADEPGFQFEGSPVADDRAIYLVGRREDALRVTSYVTAYDWNTGRLRWRRSVVAADRPGLGVVQDPVGRLLSVQHGRLFLNTNQGVVTALDARQGDILWATRYPRMKRGTFEDPEVHLLRELNPCLAYKDLVIVAPTDCRQIFALDAMTGRLVWESTTPHDIRHLLGVGDGKLLVSGDSLWWLDVHSGRVLSRFPVMGNAELARDGPNPRGAGRGLLTSKTVWWPTRKGIFLFDLQTQRHIDTIWFGPELAAKGVSGGNLAITQGHLILATADRLIAFNELGSRKVSTWPTTKTLNPLRN